MKDSSFYSHAVGCAGIEIALPKIGEGGFVRPPHTRDLFDVGLALQSLKSTRSRERLIPAPTRAGQGGSFTESWESIALAIKEAQTLSLTWEHAAKDSFLAEIEHEHISKACLQRGGVWAWDARPKGIGKTGASFDVACYDLALSLFNRSAYAPKTVALKKHTNCGWPFYRPGPAAKLAMALAARAGDFSLSQTRSVLLESAAVVGSVSEPHHTLFSRTGHTRKAQPVYDEYAGRVAFGGSARGIAPRRRAVNGVCTAENICITRMAKGLQAVLLSNPSFEHSTPDRTLAKLRAGARSLETAGEEWLVYEDDISAFDLSVQGEHQRQLKRVYATFAPEEAAYWLSIQWESLMAPPLDLAASAIMYDKPHGGETTSGMQTTSIDGNFHNLACFIACIAAGYKITINLATEWLKSGRITLLMWGDDTLWLGPKAGFDPERYVEEGAAFGYERKLRGRGREGGSFLSIFYDTTNWTWFGLASRVWINTVFREHLPAGPASEVAGYYWRTLPRGLDRNRFWPQAEASLARLPSSLSAYNVKRAEQAAQLVLYSRPFAAAVKQELKRAGIKTARYLDDMMDSADRADPGATDQLRWLRAAVGLGTTIDGLTADWVGESLKMSKNEARAKFQEYSESIAKGEGLTVSDLLEEDNIQGDDLDDKDE